MKIEWNTALVIFLIMTLLTAGMAIEHSRLAIIPLIIAVISGIVLIRIKSSNSKKYHAITQEEFDREMSESEKSEDSKKINIINNDKLEVGDDERL